jgi:hypothetical protein
MAPRFPGVDVDLGGTVYTVPPLAMRALKTYLPRMQAMETTTDGMPVDFDLLLDISLSALQRNYPDLTRDQLEELVDVVNVRKLSEAVFGKSSGLARVDGPEGNGPAAPSAGE